MRYINSFFITSIIYLITTFFLFFIFADTLIEEEKKPEEIKISLKHMMTQQESTPVQPLSEPTPIEPNSQKKIDKPKKEKKPEQKQQEHKKIAKEPISEKIEEDMPVVQVEQKTTEKPTKHIDTAQEQNIEAQYLAKIRSLIEQNKDYPKTAKRLNQSGKVFIKFVITKDGEIKNCSIEKSSQFESLDKASLEILMKIANFEAIPKELNRSSWEITVPISYQIN